MKTKILFVILLCGFILIFAPTVLAANVEVIGSISNQDIPTAGSRIVFTDSNSKEIVLEQIVSPTGQYFVSIPQGTYDIAIVPLPQSGLSQIIKRDVKINSNTMENLILPTSSSAKSLNMPHKGNVYTEIILGIIALIFGTVIGYLILKKRE